MDIRSFFRLNAVIQLIHEHTNRPLVGIRPRIYTSCPVEIVCKENGVYAFVNAKAPIFQVRLELSQYLTEELELSAEFQNAVQMVRCSPMPRCILRAPPANTTYFCGTDLPGERIFLQCKVRYCKIRLNAILSDGRALFESANFLFAGTGRCLLLQNKDGMCELVRTVTDRNYSPNHFFLSEKPLLKMVSVKGVTVDPVFCSRADEEGRFLVAAEETVDGRGALLHVDGTQRKLFLYRAGGCVILT